MGEVVTFPEEELGYWLCNCGCKTHYVRTDGEVECAQCHTLASCAGKSGYVNVPPLEGFVEQPDDALTVTQLDSPEAAIRRVLRRYTPDNMCALVVLWADGRVSTWGSHVFESKTQRGWLRRGLESARKVLIK